jgi:hypothetical protein
MGEQEIVFPPDALIEFQDVAFDFGDGVIKDGFLHVVLQQKTEFVIVLAILDAKDLLLRIRTILS